MFLNLRLPQIPLQRKFQRLLKSFLLYHLAHCEVSTSESSSHHQGESLRGSLRQDFENTLCLSMSI